ncbi:MAG: anti-sigma-factor antagonist [Chloroflexi bacterium OLB15]|nr:MAG: anti-sigma-factor antagonist [Chloroflexi bacterium OLB15]
MEAKIVLNVRAVTPLISIVDIQGEITSSAEVALADAYIRAGNAKYIVLNFSGLEYMNSSGIGLLVTLLIRAKRQGQKTSGVRVNRPLSRNIRVDAPQ